MGTVDFSEWVVQDLVIPLGGRTYRVPPPSVGRARTILALAVQSEIFLGLVKAEMPKDLQDAVNEVMDAPLGEITLGPDVYAQLIEDGHPAQTIDRMAYYAMHYWARGKARADALATLMWGTPKEDDAPGEA